MRAAFGQTGVVVPWMRHAALTVLAVWTLAVPTSTAEEAREPERCTVQVVGFGGGHIIPDRVSLSGFKTIARDIDTLQRPGVCVRTFSGVFEPAAFRWIRRSFGPGKGMPTPDQIRKGPVLILYGYSSGGWSALHLARRLAEEGLIVRLLVIVDVPWFGASVIPSNVEVAASFYQRSSLVPFYWGTDHVRLEDPSRTTFLGDIRVRKVGHFRMPQQALIRDVILSAVLGRAIPLSGDAPAIAPTPAGPGGKHGYVGTLVTWGTATMAPTGQAIDGHREWSPPVWTIDGGLWIRPRMALGIELALPPAVSSASSGGEGWRRERYREQGAMAVGCVQLVRFPEAEIDLLGGAGIVRASDQIVDPASSGQATTTVLFRPTWMLGVELPFLAVEGIAVVPSVRLRHVNDSIGSRAPAYGTRFTAGIGVRLLF
jgi:hypothetical protein